MKLYFAPNSRAVRIAWLLEELGLEYDVEKYKVGDRALKLLRVALGNVDNRLQDREYLTGTFTGADIMTGHACFGAMNAGAEIDDYEHLNAYINRLLKRPALEKARSL